MKLTILGAGTVGVAGLISAGLLALPLTATAASDDNPILKRDDDTPELVLVTEDDDADDTGLAKRDNTRSQVSRATRDANTRTGNNTRTGRNDPTNTRTGSNSGRDNSRAKPQKDWTRDGAGDRTRDWSRNSTNDRSRNNTRGR